MEELFSSPELSEFPLSLHLAMIQDRVRMEAYVAAMQTLIKPEHTVADVGTGTGVMAMLAARCGARAVFGLERSKMVDYASKITALNCPEAPITYLSRDVLSDDLSDIQADILVCELLGNFGIDENMIEVLSTTRQKILKPGGQIIPAALELVVAPVQCTRAYRDVASWRRREWDIDFSPLQQLAYNAVYQITSEPVRLLAQPQILKTVDFATVTEPSRSSTTCFDVQENGTLHGIAGWFRCTLAPGQVLDTGPKQPATHWGQVLFPIGDPLRVEPGAAVEFEFTEQTVGLRVRWHWRGSIRSPTRSKCLSRFSYAAVREFPEL